MQRDAFSFAFHFKRPSKASHSSDDNTTSRWPSFLIRGNFLILSPIEHAAELQESSFRWGPVSLCSVLFPKMYKLLLVGFCTMVKVRASMVLSFPIYGHIAKSTYVFISILLISFEFQRGVGDPPNTLFTLFRVITCFSSPLNSRKRQWTENEKCLWYEASQGIWIEGSGASSQSQSILSGEHSDSVLPLLANKVKRRFKPRSEVAERARSLLFSPMKALFQLLR